MDEVKEIINNMIALKGIFEEKIYKYMYIINDKVELDKAIAEDKEFINRMQSLLGENINTISITKDNISMPSLDNINNEALPSMDKTDDNLDNTSKDLDESSTIEMLDLGSLNEKQEETPIIDELQELTSSSKSTEEWTPPEIFQSGISTTNDEVKENPSLANLNVEMPNLTIPEAETPSNDDYKPVDDLNSVGATSTNKFIMPEFMNGTSQSL